MVPTTDEKGEERIHAQERIEEEKSEEETYFLP